MNGRIARAVWAGLSIAAVLGLLHWWGVGLPLLLTAVVVFGVVAKWSPQTGVRWLDELVLAVRTWLWKRESGRHHSFAGITLDIEETQGQVWISAESLQSAIRRPEAETITAARLASFPTLHARHNDEKVLMLNVQAVVQHLSTMPGRAEPRVLRLRRYLEREVLFPASLRRRRRTNTV